jgi:hypothetical protein
MMGYILWYIPQENRKNPDEFRRARQFILFTHIAFLFFVINMIKWYKLGAMNLAVSMGCVMVLMAGVPLILKATRSFPLMVNFAIALVAWHFIYLPYNTGGLHSSALQWNVILPGLAFTFLGIRNSIFWAMAMILVCVTFIVLAAKGVVMPTIPLTPEQLFQVQVANVLGPITVLSIVLYFNRKGLQFALETEYEAMKVAEQAAQEQIQDKERITAMAQQAQNTLDEVEMHTESLSSTATEIAAMAEKNAFSARSAESLMQQAEEMVLRANESMSHLTVSMREMSEESRKMSDIIKTIDGIAFQTNLLSLNASVEAARAGEAGAGFAVVATEVRSLAQRSAESAKYTSGMIEMMKKVVDQGRATLEDTNQDFQHVADRVAKTGTLIREISAGSEEQRQGVTAINQAVSNLTNLILTGQNIKGKVKKDSQESVGLLRSRATNRSARASRHRISN